jgi:hypothetical protein
VADSPCRFRAFQGRWVCPPIHRCNQWFREQFITLALVVASHTLPPMSLKVFGRNLALVASLGVLKAPIADWTRELNQILARQADLTNPPGVTVDVRPQGISDTPDEEHDARSAVSSRTATGATQAGPSIWVPPIPNLLPRRVAPPLHNVAAWTPPGPLPSSGSDLPDLESPTESAQAMRPAQRPQGRLIDVVANDDVVVADGSSVVVENSSDPAKPDDTEREYSTESAQAARTPSAQATGMQYIRPEGIESAEAFGSPSVRVPAPRESNTQALDYLVSASPESRAAFLERLRKELPLPLPGAGDDGPDQEFPTESAQGARAAQGPQGEITARIASRSPAQGPQGPQGEQLPQRRMPKPVAAMEEGPTLAKPDDSEREYSTASAQRVTSGAGGTIGNMSANLGAGATLSGTPLAIVNMGANLSAGATLGAGYAVVAVRPPLLRPVTAAGQDNSEAGVCALSGCWSRPATSDLVTVKPT